MDSEWGEQLVIHSGWPFTVHSLCALLAAPEEGASFINFSSRRQSFFLDILYSTLTEQSPPVVAKRRRATRDRDNKHNERCS